MVIFTGKIVKDNDVLTIEHPTFSGGSYELDKVFSEFKNHVGEHVFIVFDKEENVIKRLSPCSNEFDKETEEVTEVLEEVLQKVKEHNAK